MTISLPGSSRKGLKGLFKRKATDTKVATVSQRKLGGADVAKLFDKKARTAKAAKPAKLSETEVSASEQMSNLRGALYADK